MDDVVFLYRNRSDTRFYDANTQEMRGGPDKVIVYLDGVLCAMDRETKITIPVSRWKLAEIGLVCFWTALRGEKARSVVRLRLCAFLNRPWKLSRNHPRRRNGRGPKTRGIGLCGRCATCRGEPSSDADLHNRDRAAGSGQVTNEHPARQGLRNQASRHVKYSIQGFDIVDGGHDQN
jgi:hypothetical protein